MLGEIYDTVTLRGNWNLADVGRNQLVHLGKHLIGVVRSTFWLLEILILVSNMKSSQAW
jgi:hypothetical protein